MAATASDVRGEIVRLAEDEREVSARLATFPIQTDERAVIAQHALALPPKNARPIADSDLGFWGSTSRSASILQLLLHHRRLFVDVGAWSEEQFVTETGVTAGQLLQLAQKGYVILSLYWFDSYCESVRREPLSQPSYESEKCRHLWPLIQRREEVGLRIASIRRREFFKRVGLQEGDTVNKWTSAVRPALNLLGDDGLSRALGRPDAGGVQILCSHLEYLSILGNGNIVVQELLHRVDAWDRSEIGQIENDVRLLNAAKHRIATPLTTAWGGTWNMSWQQSRRLERLDAYSWDRFGMRELRSASTELEARVSPEVESFTELVARAAFEKKRPTKVKNAAVSFPRPPTQNQFRSFLAFLEEHQSQVHAIEGVAEMCRHNESATVECWQDYLRFLEEIEERIARSKVLSEGASETAQEVGAMVLRGGTPVVGFLLGQLANERVDEVLSGILGIAGVFAGASLSGILTTRLERTRRSSERARLVALMDEVWGP